MPRESDATHRVGELGEIQNTRISLDQVREITDTAAIRPEPDMLRANFSCDRRILACLVFHTVTRAR